MYPYQWTTLFFRYPSDSRCMKEVENVGTIIVLRRKMGFVQVELKNLSGYYIIKSGKRSKCL